MKRKSKIVKTPEGIIMIPKNSLPFDEVTYLVIFIINIFESLRKKLEDKKFTWAEKVQLLTELTPIFHIVKNWRTLKEQIKDLKPDEIAEIILIIKEEFDLTNEAAEQKVDWALNTLSIIFKGLAELKN